MSPPSLPVLGTKLTVRFTGGHGSSKVLPCCPSHTSSIQLSWFLRASWISPELMRVFSSGANKKKSKKIYKHTIITVTHTVLQSTKAELETTLFCTYVILCSCGFFIHSAFTVAACGRVTLAGRPFYQHVIATSNPVIATLRIQSYNKKK